MIVLLAGSGIRDGGTGRGQWGQIKCVCDGDGLGLGWDGMG